MLPTSSLNVSLLHRLASEMVSFAGATADASERWFWMVQADRCRQQLLAAEREAEALGTLGVAERRLFYAREREQSISTQRLRNVVARYQRVVAVLLPSMPEASFRECLVRLLSGQPQLRDGVLHLQPPSPEWTDELQGLVTALLEWFPTNRLRVEDQNLWASCVHFTSGGRGEVADFLQTVLEDDGDDFSAA